MTVVHADGRVVVFPVRQGDVAEAALRAIDAWQDGATIHAQHPGWSRRVA